MFNVRHAYAYYEIRPEEFFGNSFPSGRFVHIEKSDNEGLGWYTLTFGTVKSIENGIAYVTGDDGQEVTVDKTMHLRTHVEMPKYCSAPDLHPGQWFRIAQPHDLKRYPPSLRESFYAPKHTQDGVYLCCAIVRPSLDAKGNTRALVRCYAYPIAQPAFDLMVKESPRSRFSEICFQAMPQGTFTILPAHSNVILLRGPTYD